MTIDSHRHAEQEALMKALNPQIIGWSAYYAPVVSARVFQRLDHTVYAMLWGWAVSRHPKQAKHWIARKYWRVDDGQGWRFQPSNSTRHLARHDHTPHQRYVKGQDTRSPYDGDWLYWSRRLGHHPNVSPRIARLLKQQQGRCRACGLYSWMVTKSKSITSCPQSKEGAMREKSATVTSTLSRYENSQGDWWPRYA